MSAAGIPAPSAWTLEMLPTKRKDANYVLSIPKTDLPPVEPCVNDSLVSVFATDASGGVCGTLSTMSILEGRPYCAHPGEILPGPRISIAFVGGDIEKLCRLRRGDVVAIDMILSNHPGLGVQYSLHGSAQLTKPERPRHIGRVSIVRTVIDGIPRLALKYGGVGALLVGGNVVRQKQPPDECAEPQALLHRGELLVVLPDKPDSNAPVQVPIWNRTSCTWIRVVVPSAR